MGQPVVHFEIGVRDREKAEAFYAALFGWRIDRSGPASLIDTDGGTGINGHITSLGHAPHHYVTFYAAVEDLPACLARAESLGGRTIVPPVDIPAGTFAWLADPDGNTIDVCGDTAVATCPWEMEWEAGGEARREAGHDVFVLARRDGRWLAVWRTVVPLAAGG